MYSQLIRLAQNNSNQLYILNGQWIKMAFASKYSSSFCKGKLYFLLPTEIEKFFFNFKYLNLETLEWEIIESICEPKKELIKKCCINRPSQAEYPYEFNFKTITILGKKKLTNVIEELVNYIDNNFDDIQSTIEENINLVDTELKDKTQSPMKELYMDSCIFPTHKMFSEGERKYGKEIYNKDILYDLDQYVLCMYNGGVWEKSDDLWIRFKLQLISKNETQLLKAMTVRRLISFCKVKSC